MSYTALHANDTEREIDRLERELTALKDRLKAARTEGAAASPRPPSARSVLTARRAREELISRELFADPAWDMLLALHDAEPEQGRISTTQLCIESAVPATTALRWLAKLEHLGFVVRTVDPLDARRIWVALSSSAREKMNVYFQALGGDLWPA